MYLHCRISLSDSSVYPKIHFRSDRGSLITSILVKLVIESMGIISYLYYFCNIPMCSAQILFICARKKERKVLRQENTT